MAEIDSHFVVGYYDSFITEQTICIIMEYCPYGPLFNFLREGKQTIPPKRLVDWTKQIASGMKYLHDHKIIHRDLKSPK